MPAFQSTVAAVKTERVEKSDNAFRTIAEAAALLNVQTHVLRFWETKFTKIKPVKMRGGRRYYRPEDIEILKQIRDLLYFKGYTIRGVQKLLRDKEEYKSEIEEIKKEQEPVVLHVAGIVAAQDINPPEPQNQNLNLVDKDQIKPIISELEELQALLKKASAV
jgi:DNA-binding transcriptional MerR regulator